MRRFLSFVLSVVCAASCGTNQDNCDETFVSSLSVADYEPVSVLKGQDHHPQSAKFSVIDIHSHAYAETKEQVQEWADKLIEHNISRVIVLTCAYGKEFDKLYDLYTGVSDKFEMWCGFDMSAFGTPDFSAKAIAELERCAEKGAKGVGELTDKGMGAYSSMTLTTPGPHFDDALFIPIFSKCAELGLPVNIHVGDPIWMYQPIDEHNDGYPNAETWKIDLVTPGILNLEQLVKSFERTCDRNPGTQFIACHLMNMSHDYETLGAVLERHPNLMLDVSARHLETCITPRATARFYEKYRDKIMFGTDNTPTDAMYRLQWRILETEDEHFYDPDDRSYHWALYGLGLSDDLLNKIYYGNAASLLKID